MYNYCLDLFLLLRDVFLDVFLDSFFSLSQSSKSNPKQTMDTVCSPHDAIYLILGNNFRTFLHFLRIGSWETLFARNPLSPNLFSHFATQNRPLI